MCLAEVQIEASVVCFSFSDDLFSLSEAATIMSTLCLTSC